MILFALTVNPHFFFYLFGCHPIFQCNVRYFNSPIAFIIKTIFRSLPCLIKFTDIFITTFCKETEALRSETSGYSFVSYGFSQKQHKPAINLQIRNRTLLGWTGSPVAIPLISECYWLLLDFLDIQCCFKHLPQKFDSTLFRCAFSVYLVSLIRQPKSSPDLKHCISFPQRNALPEAIRVWIKLESSFSILHSVYFHCLYRENY